MMLKLLLRCYQVARPQGAQSDYKQAEAKALAAKIKAAEEELERRESEVKRTLTRLRVS